MKIKSVSVIASLLVFHLFGIFPTAALSESIPESNADVAGMPCKIPLVLRDGYYVGIAAGYDVYKMKYSTGFQDTAAEYQISTDPKLALNGMIGDFFLGYGRQFGSKEIFYLGLEFFANGSAADNDFQISQPDYPVIIDTDVVVNGSYGLSVVPGLKINNTTMLYFKAGYNWSTVSIDETVRSEHDFDFKSIEYNDEVTTGGVMYGLGFESAFYELFTLRIEYSHADYNSFSTASGARVAPSRNQFMLGLIYHFYPKQ